MGRYSFREEDRNRTRQRKTASLKKANIFVMGPEGQSSSAAPVLVLFRKSLLSVTFSIYYPI
jgi:hypothetical protein